MGIALGDKTLEKYMLCVCTRSVKELVYAFSTKSQKLTGETRETCMYRVYVRDGESSAILYLFTSGKKNSIGLYQVKS